MQRTSPVILHLRIYLAFLPVAFLVSLCLGPFVVPALIGGAISIFVFLNAARLLTNLFVATIDPVGYNARKNAGGDAFYDSM